MQCCSRPKGLKTKVWSLPKAVVSDGENVEEDIREGDESLISVNLEGEPPFTFSWSRTLGSVVESFTVENVRGYEVWRFVSVNFSFPPALAVGGSRRVLRSDGYSGSFLFIPSYASECEHR